MRTAEAMRTLAAKSRLTSCHSYIARGADLGTNAAADTFIISAAQLTELLDLIQHPHTGSCTAILPQKTTIQMLIIIILIFDITGDQSQFSRSVTQQLLLTCLRRRKDDTVIRQRAT